MEVEDLRALLHIAEHGSVRGAAQRLGLERSSLRRQLERLERHFGTPLLMRDGRGVRLTPAGELAVAQARPLLAELSRLVEQAQALSGQATGVARLLIPIGMPATFRVQALHLLRSRHPQLALDVREVPDPLRWTHLPFDLLAHFGPPPEGMDLVSQVLARPSRRLLASPAYLEAQGAPDSVEALARHRVIAWRTPGRPEDQLPLRGGGQVALRPWVLTSDAALALEAAQQGLALAFMPELFAPGLQPVLAEQLGDTLTLRLSSKRPSRVDPQVAALLGNVNALLDGSAPTRSREQGAVNLRNPDDIGQ
ncbi:MAG: LysR family transcriptional regulator [Alphaproteobacteria bacterium]|nr:LysR family transcriptional regulator [Alphaproteobacteria bacterium]